MARKYYIPITRSGSSILASLFAQRMERYWKSRPPHRDLGPIGGAILLVMAMILFTICFCGVPTSVGVPLAWLVVVLGVILLLAMKIAG